IAFQVSALRAAIDGPWSPRKIRFPHARPKRVAALEDLLQCPIGFDAPALEVEIARDELDLRLHRSDPALHQVLSASRSNSTLVFRRRGPASSISCILSCWRSSRASTARCRMQLPGWP